jgi:hypothetical protein
VIRARPAVMGIATILQRRNVVPAQIHVILTIFVIKRRNVAKATAVFPVIVVLTVSAKQVLDVITAIL